MNLPDPTLRSEDQLRSDALAIWRAGVDAVASDRLTHDSIYADAAAIEIEDVRWVPREDSRVLVVGAGKAGAGMVLGLEKAFGPELLKRFRVDGWVNVPSDCVVPTQSIHLHPARPAGVNLPTQSGVEGSEKILDAVQHLRPQDLCICLISGGGSALLPAPREGVTLADKLRVTERLAEVGANIIELNSVRKSLSRIKGGGLATACNAAMLITLIISDVPGDPIASIASGPTCLNSVNETPAATVLRKYRLADEFPQLMNVLTARPQQGEKAASARIENRIIGNNAVAVDAAGMEAERRGYSHAMTSSREPENDVRELGMHFAGLAKRMRETAGPDCLISGGEPTVVLPSDGFGKGGRNQQLVLEFWHSLRQLQAPGKPQPSGPVILPGGEMHGICMLSGGTDGEDGATDAAGAIVDGMLVRQANQLNLDPDRYRVACDAYPFWKEVGGLIVTGPTHTNVCDLRVIVVDRCEPQLRKPLTE